MSHCAKGLELVCPAEAGRLPWIVTHAGGPSTPPYGPARRGQPQVLVISQGFSELLGGAGSRLHLLNGTNDGGRGSVRGDLCAAGEVC